MLYKYITIRFNKKCDVLNNFEIIISFLCFEMVVVVVLCAYKYNRAKSV